MSALPYSEYDASPPNRVDLLSSIGPAAKFTTALVWTSNASTWIGTANCCGAPEPCTVT